jgi:hypothetical protein
MYDIAVPAYDGGVFSVLGPCEVSSSCLSALTWFCNSATFLISQLHLDSLPVARERRRLRALAGDVLGLVQVEKLLFQIVELRGFRRRERRAVLQLLDALPELRRPRLQRVQPEIRDILVVDVEDAAIQALRGGADEVFVPHLHGEAAGAFLQHRHLALLAAGDDQRRVRGDDELHVRERVAKQLQDLLLPERVQMGVDFIDHHDARLFRQRVFGDRGVHRLQEPVDETHHAEHRQRALRRLLQWQRVRFVAVCRHQDAEAGVVQFDDVKEREAAIGQSLDHVLHQPEDRPIEPLMPVELAAQLLQEVRRALPSQIESARNRREGVVRLFDIAHVGDGEQRDGAKLLLEHQT